MSIVVLTRRRRKMCLKKVSLIFLVFPLLLVSIVSCTAGTESPNIPIDPVSVKPVDYTLCLDVTVWTSDNEPAYPSRVNISAFRILRNGKTIDLQSVVKYVQENGAAEVEFAFNRVYPEDTIRYKVEYANATLWIQDDIHGYEIVKWADGNSIYYHEVRRSMKYSITLKEFEKKLSNWQ
jgi:hypothetical protein